jgi:hypothetical protein
VLCQLEVGELEEVMGVGAGIVGEEAPVGSYRDAVGYGALVFHEDTEAGVFGAADYKQGTRVRRPRKWQGAGEFIRKALDDGRG